MNPALICVTMMAALLDGYAGERYLPECIVERHRGRTARFMVWGVVAYKGRSHLQRIVDKTEQQQIVLEPEGVIFLHVTYGDICQQDNACPHITRNFQDFL